MGKKTMKVGSQTTSAAGTSLLPRRTSSRLARSSVSDAGKRDTTVTAKECILHSPSALRSLRGTKLATVEVAIPLKKQSPACSTSSSDLVEDISGDGMNAYNTPESSVADTPIELDMVKPRKRVSASARARELRSSIMSLNTQKGPKRDLATIIADDHAIESSDAALAQNLQLQEYQESSKRCKTRGGLGFAGEDSTDNDSILTEPSYNEGNDTGVDARKYPARKTRNSIRRIVSDRESNITEDESGDEQEYFSGSDSTSSMDVGPVSQRIRALTRSRAGARTQARASMVSLSTEPEVRWPGMSYRALRERKKLERQHPYIIKMWDELRNSPPITPIAAEQPPGISRNLKSFQLEGLNWMMRQEKSQYKGGLLGDEMGMGKTIQAVSLLMSDYPVGQPSLVVVPPVALMQWQSEIKEYTNGQLKVLIYHNSNSKTKSLSKRDLLTYDVIMISYSGLESIHRKEWKGWNRSDGIVKEDSIIHSIHYHRLILDEAHSIKQRTTSVARACFALKAKYKWCLSGTPVQNRIGEFFSLLRFLEIRPFACYFCKQCKCQELHWSQDAAKRCTHCNHSGFSHVSIFNQEILNPITERNNSEARKEALSKLRLITDRIMLRRIKRDHTASMELPPKRVVLHNEFFGEIERDFSRSIMTNSTRQFDTYVSRGVMLNNYANIFGLIMQMRQVANHPDLILKKHAESGQNVLVCSICDEPAEEAIRSRCRHEFCRRCAKDYVQSFDAGSVVDCPRCHIPLSVDFEQPDIEQEEEHIKKNSIINRIRMENWTSSTKIEMLVYELYKLRSKKQTHKSIVFSQFTSMLQLVEWRLRRAGFNTVMLDGTMTPAQRQKSIDFFMNNVDVEVFLVSLKAGGVALNLTEASRVFIVDPWWNPAAEWQSADRCHRIGQRRPCVITRLCIEDSVESRIVLLQEKKANLINGTINKDQGEALEKLTPEDMQFLFRGS
ncbi:SNF2 family N-terminal domain-containing protein [Aspergillus bertholletiae]|uniref:SNF2 family N-terminal domain-containing protein n=1 Tax=Aspergillus bertholletiae TaxID=1226010 RepID=A0A5N7B918_9EURO|nr:SNF2 family N-terminal domain-containing protein [Aspergillus bertholletiae]